MLIGVASESPQKHRRSRLCWLHLWRRKSKNSDLRWLMSWWNKTPGAAISPSVTLRNCRLLTGAAWLSRRMSSIMRYKRKRLWSWTRQEIYRRRRSGHNWKSAARSISSSNKISRCKVLARSILFTIGSRSRWESKKMRRFSKFKKKKPKKAWIFWIGVYRFGSAGPSKSSIDEPRRSLSFRQITRNITMIWFTKSKEHSRRSTKNW